jgi:hypothetical protein
MKTHQHAELYGLEQAIDEAHQVFLIARRKGRADWMAAAVMLKARLVGLIVSDRKNERSPLRDNGPNQVPVVDKAATAQADAAIRHAQKRPGEPVA